MPEVAVVGGGPAGLIAAETLAVQGASVTVYEHRRSAGRKFLLAGRGGLNITHSEALADLLVRYGAAQDKLESVIDDFAPADLRAWCAGHDEETFVGTSGRVFPRSFRATPLLRSWLRRLDELGVSLETGHCWVGWSEAGALQFDTDTGGRMVCPDATVFALGGASWPRVGSDGSWVDTFRHAGIDVAELQAANCGVRLAWSDVMRSRFAGQPIKNTVFTRGDMVVRGDGMVTDTGLEGGPIYALGPAIRSELASERTATIRLDTQPDLTVDRLTERLSKRRPKASITSWLNSAAVDSVSVALAREATGNELPEQPAALATLLKDLPLEITGMESLDRAISTAGGVRFEAIDHNWMVKDRPGTFVAGEMVDWEAPTGGYLLQACFSTGVAAARGALAWCSSGEPN